MTPNEIDREMLRFVADALPAIGATDVPVTPEAHLRRDLGLDSLATLALCVAFEKRFGVRLTHSDVAAVRTVADLLAVGRKARLVSAPGI